MDRGRTDRAHLPVDLAVIVPTKDEAEGIDAFLGRLGGVLAELEQTTEVIVVDDSSDGTAAIAGGLAPAYPTSLRVIHRGPGDRKGGLGGAVVEGVSATRAPWVCVIDADFQHPPEVVESLLEGAAADVDLVIGSRYRAETDTSGMSRLRRGVSRALVALTRLAFPARLRHVTDPLSGLFLFRRERVALDRLRPAGFKILLEILVRNPGLRVAEITYDFGRRTSGTSKAGALEGLRFTALVLRLRFGDTSERVTRFALVGASGLLVNMLLFWLFVEGFGLHYLAAALLATQGSTAWNFALAESWVFHDRRHRFGRGARALMFFGMNNAAFLLRGPILYALVSQLAIDDVVANLLSLLALTAIRFLVADLWIWRRSTERPHRTYHYAVHDLASIESDTPLPELERFQTDEPARRPTIRVRIGHLTRSQSELVSALAFFARHLRYDEGLGRLGFTAEIGIGKSIELVASPLLRRSPHVLYTNLVEPVLRWTLVRSGCAFVHGACICHDSRAFLVTARTDTGKTTTVLKTLTHRPFGFLSDDLTIVAPDGRVLMYPKPLTISRHTLAAVDRASLNRRERIGLIPQSRLHSRSGRKFALVLARTGLPVATINAVVQRIVPPPKYDVERLLPGSSVVGEARLSGVIVIERATDDGVHPLSSSDTVETLFANTGDAFGFPPYPEVEAFLCRRSRVDLRALERDIVSQAVASVPAIVVRSSSMDWWQQVAAFMGSPEKAATSGAEGTPRPVLAGAHGR